MMNNVLKMGEMDSIFKDVNVIKDKEKLWNVPN